MKVVLPPIVEKENDVTVVDSFMTDIDSVYAEVADGLQGNHKKEWRTVSYGVHGGEGALHVHEPKVLRWLQ
jgi:hypothetical protein